MYGWISKGAGLHPGTVPHRRAGPANRNPRHYDESVAKASRFGEIVVQGGLTSAILNAVVAEVLEVRTDKPITKLKTSVVRDDGTLVLDGDAVCYTMPIAKDTNTQQ